MNSKKLIGDPNVNGLTFVNLPNVTCVHKLSWEAFVPTFLQIFSVGSIGALSGRPDRKDMFVGFQLESSHQELT